MCMWQSQAFAGALSLGASLPSEFGTVCCASAGAPAATAALAPAKNVRRPMVMLTRRLLVRLFLSVSRWIDCTATACPADGAKSASAWPRLHGSAQCGPESQSGGAMRTGFFTVLVCAAFSVPALALDKKLDPDPAFLAKARTAATATVEPHYDLMSDKVPLGARFMICAGQLPAARDEGRALPVPQADLDKLIADYRGRAAELVAYRQKTDAKAPATDINAEIAKIRSGAMQFLPADTTKLGVEHMKKLHGQRVAFCQLTRDWYEVQNGIRTATPAAEQQKLTKQHDEAMRQIAANSAKPPMPPVLRPTTVQPIARE